MSWEDRLRDAAYTSPSGIRLAFAFENVTNARTKKTNNFEFPDADGTFVQESGATGRSFPLRCIFWGADYDQEAEAFDAALFETGVGKLEHPIYGTVDVVPTGTITRRDDLKTAANQAFIDVTFMSTIGLIYPSSQLDPASEVISAVADFNAALAEEFGDNIDLDSAVEKATFKSKFDAALDEVEGGLTFIAETSAEVGAEFNAINDSINRGIDVLISQPLTLAFQTMQLIQAPARAFSLISAKLDAYLNLANSLIYNSDGDIATSSGANDFYTADLYASTYITGAILSTVNTQFETRVGAIDAAVLILEQFEAVSAWKDANLTELELIDTGAAYQQLQDAVAVTAGFLVEISFSLKQERRIKLDRARTIVDLSAELYSSVDDKLDFLINSNDLSGSEILELPKGKEIVYYV